MLSKMLKKKINDKQFLALCFFFEYTSNTSCKNHVYVYIYICTAKQAGIGMASKIIHKIKAKGKMRYILLRQFLIVLHENTFVNEL
jgi:hypothetical protein